MSIDDGPVVVGGGPAGLAAAVELRALDISPVTVIEREREAGGIPRHSDHSGFGLRDLRTLLSGPRYAHRYRELAEEAAVEVLTETMVTEWNGDRSLKLTGPHGRWEIEPPAVVLATGCRERPRSARLVPGSRPGSPTSRGINRCGPSAPEPPSATRHRSGHAPASARFTAPSRSNRSS
jgi:NADPH-dependent 2,4-dienoyl-CoA reductase/sulfur reductase-like enzyme